MQLRFLVSAVVSLSLMSLTLIADDAPTSRQAARWRREHRIIDLHQHIDSTPERLARAVKIMDAAGVGLEVNLSGGTVTRPKDGGPSEFERNKQLADTLYPGRFLLYMNLDYDDWDDPDFSRNAVKQIDEGHRLGAAGFKEYKRLGLYLRDRAGKLLKIDDPKLDPVWHRCGELGMPVSIHAADPKAFWMPYNDKNERWQELKDHPSWWFGDTNKFPAWKELLESLNRVIARHPETTFVCVHFANNAEELDWVDASLSRYPNMFADLAARIPEIGRHDPDQVRRLFLKYQDRILFGTDFQVYGKLILGSSGNEPPATDADAEVFFAKEWRWLETSDRDWPHMTPIQGNWTISSINLPAAVLRKIYFDNARKLLGRSMPLPVVRARHISQDFVPNGNLDEPVWQTAEPVRIECQTTDYAARPELETKVRLLWSHAYLYLAYECPYTRLTVFEPPQFNQKRYNMEQPGASLWDRDVVEAFIRSDPSSPNHYTEYQVAPTNERLDLALNLPNRDFAWTSGFESAVKVDDQARVWTCEWRIPMQALSETRPETGTRWRINLFRADRANKALLAWSPTMNGNFHTPEKFGILEFVE
ncbi:MAG: amidohydrolase family protein [Candidatus Omnitrophica bacterium]|nr:amidohydrolase family protein [Candidatus Omnitrophota bacterium]